jgi:SAM-dependent methyltransferase
MADEARWEDRYRTGDVPWDTGRPSSELQRVMAEDGIEPGRAVELGCGTGTNAIWLAQQGFDVTGVDLSELAIERAQAKAASASVRVTFLQADVLALPDLGLPFKFFFDRGCYHAVRRHDVAAYLRSLERITRPGTLGLVLAGNAREPHDPGPPVVDEPTLRAELGSIFEVVRLREFYFDQTATDAVRPLAWSCLLRRAQ